MWAKAVEQTANMMTMSPYPGFKGELFSMPCRNVLPKPYQKPHPPNWVACSRRETIHEAARHGIGAPLGERTKAPQIFFTNLKVQQTETDRPERPAHCAARRSAGHKTRKEGRMDLGITGKTAIVEAASKGLGKGCAMALAEEGVHLVINARTADVLEATAQEIRQQTGVSVAAVAGVTRSCVLNPTGNDKQGCFRLFCSA